MVPSTGPDQSARQTRPQRRSVGLGNTLGSIYVYITNEFCLLVTRSPPNPSLRKRFINYFALVLKS